MDEGIYLIIIIILVVILFCISSKYKNEITSLRVELRETVRLCDKLKDVNNKIEKDYDNTIKLLQAEQLKLKDYLIKRLADYINIENDYMPQPQVSKKYQELLENIIDDYNTIFIDSDDAIDEVSRLAADYYTFPVLLEESKMQRSRDLYKRALTVKEMREQTAEIIKQVHSVYYQAEQDLARIEKLNTYEKLIELSDSNTKLIPFLSKLISEIETADFEVFARSLDYGNSVERKSRITTIRQVRQEAKSKIESLKWAEYQLQYLLTLYPTLQDVIETEFNELTVSVEEITDSDPVRNYLSVEEWKNLSTTEKNQLALDRYVESRKKSKWQIGRDYELYIGYCYEKKGYEIDYFGSYMGLEDLGRDLIAKKGKETLIIQCKYWGKEKKIHEKHIMQLYGSLIAYKIEHNTDNISGVLVTNIELSETAKKFANMLNIEYLENKAIDNFPRIKCNIGHDEYGNATKIYHLPMDFQYDRTKIEKKGESMVTTVAEAEELGFRRTYKWHGNN